MFPSHGAVPRWSLFTLLTPRHLFNMLPTAQFSANALVQYWCQRKGGLGAGSGEPGTSCPCTLLPGSTSQGGLGARDTCLRGRSPCTPGESPHPGSSIQRGFLSLLQAEARAPQRRVSAEARQLQVLAQPQGLHRLVAARAGSSVTAAGPEAASLGLEPRHT